LQSALRHRRIVIFGVVGFAVLSFLLFKFIGTEFFPDTDESQFSILIRLPVGTRIEETTKFVERVENIIKKNVPEVRTMISDIGVPSQRSGNLFGSNPGSHAANLSIQLVPPSDRSRSVFEIMNKLRPMLTRLPGAKIYLNPSGFLRFLLNFGSSAPIDVVISGEDFNTSNKLAQEVSNAVSSTPGATDVLISRDNNLPELQVVIDREKQAL